MPSRFNSNNFVSPRIAAQIRLRLVELGGFSIWALALALMVALWSYNPGDPSPDTATTQAATNLLGIGGAYVSDTLVQWFGVVSALPVLVLLAWGWRIFRHSGLRAFVVRVVALFCALPVMAATLAAVSLLVPHFPALSWPTGAGIGGAVGLSIARSALEVGSATLGSAGSLIVWILGGALTLLLVPLAVGLSWAEWRGIGRIITRVARLLARQAALLKRVLIDRIRADNEAPAGFAGQMGPMHAGGVASVAGGGAARPLSAGRTPAPEAFNARATPRPAATPRSQAGSSWVQPPGVSDHENVPLLAGPVAVYDAPDEPDFDAPALSTPKSEERAGLFGRLLGGLGEKMEKPVPGFAGAATSSSSSGAQARAARARDDGTDAWRFPSLELLRAAPARSETGPAPEMLQANARLLETVLSDYGVSGAIVDIHAGPVVTLYELEPAPGIRSARVIGLADDIARSLSVLSVRIATVPGRNVIGIEVPNALRETVYFSELLNTDAWVRNPGQLCIALGKDIAGEPVYSDLARMPHLLIAGTTGSGKSVGVNAMILSLLYRLSPDECRLIMIDPKILELSIYDGIPHLMTPVVTEPSKAVTALKWTVREMDRRYRSMSHLQVRNIGGYNERVTEARARGEIVTRRVQTGYDPETGRPIFEEQQLALDTLPYIVVIIDEVADLMMVAGKEIEACVQRLAQKARAAGIHVIMATQRPSVDVITGTIKANFPTRISFQVISKFDSRTILGEQGAEQLLGQGDMLYMQGGGRITRVHGPFVGDAEVEEVVRYLRSQGEPIYNDEVTTADDDDSGSGSGGSGSGSGNGLNGSYDGETSLFDQAVAIVAREGKASTSFIQRHLSIGYNRAAKLIEQMEKEGIVSEANHVGRREVLIRRTSDE